jgi:cell shape-determining protein MreD
MNTFVGIVAILMVIAVQVSAWPNLTPRVMPAFALAAALAWGYSAGRLAGFKLAVLLGVILDLYAQHNFGMFTVAMAVGAAVPALISRDEDDGLAPQAVALVVAGFLYELVLLIWISVADAQAAFFANLLQVATLNTVGTVVVGLLMTLAVAAYATRTPRTNEQRPLRL